MPGLAELILAGDEEEEELLAAPVRKPKASLAQLILAEDEEDEDVLEDPELARQIAALQAKKAALLAEAQQRAESVEPLPASRSPASPPPAAAAAAPPAAAAAPAAEAAAAPSGAGAATAGQPWRTSALGKSQTLGRTQGASLAELLRGGGEGGGGGDPGDRELEAMERELQKQMQDYRQKCKVAGQEPPAFTTTAAAVPARRGSAGAGAPAAAGAEPGGANEVVGEELQEMMSLAAKLEQAFPEPSEEGAAEPPAARAKPQLQHALGWAAHREADRAAAPIDNDVYELQGALEDLDVRLRALQSREALREADEEEQQSSAALAPEASRAIAEMRAQNQHLRERFGATQSKGRLMLDRGLFQVAVCPGAGEAAFASGVDGGTAAL